MNPGTVVAIIALAVTLMLSSKKVLSVGKKIAIGDTNIFDDMDYNDWNNNFIHSLKPPLLKAETGKAQECNREKSGCNKYNRHPFKKRWNI